MAVGSENYESYDFDLQDIINIYGLKPNDTHHALKKLEEEGFIQLSDAYYSPSKFIFMVNHHDLYSFQLRNQSYEKFTKLLLRIYGGELFTSYTSISESVIAKAYFAPVSEVETMLMYLEKSQIAHYEKQKQKPQLSFLTPRYDADYLPINFIALQNRKKNELEKVQFMKNYIQESRRCRMLLLQEYFDDYSDKVCGICDNCLARKRAGISAAVFENYRSQILALLPISVQDLRQDLRFQKQETLAEVIRILLEKEEIILSQEGIFEKNK